MVKGYQCRLVNILWSAREDTGTGDAAFGVLTECLTKRHCKGYVQKRQQPRLDNTFRDCQNTRSKTKRLIEI